MFLAEKSLWSNIKKNFPYHSVILMSDSDDMVKILGIIWILILLILD